MKLDAKSVEALRAGIGPLRALFAQGIAPFFDPNVFQDAVDRWEDSHRSGGVAQASRPGYALRQPDLGALPSGLLQPEDQRLDRTDIPSSEIALQAFLTKMIVANRARQFRDDVAKAIEVATYAIAGRDGVRNIADHASALWALSKSHPALFEAAVLGDFQAAGRELKIVSDNAMHTHIVRIIARQRLLWAMFDVHRVAAHGQNFTDKIVPWFMKPFLSSGNIRPVLTLMDKVGKSIIRYAQNAVVAEAAGHLDQVRVHGADDRRAVLKPVAEEMSGGLSLSNLKDISAARPLVVKGTSDLIDQIDKGLKATDDDLQMSIHEWFYDLTDLGALHMVAYAAAAEEARLIEIIADPESADDLFEIDLRPARTNGTWPYRTRARHLVAAYRGAVMTSNRSGPYDPREVFTADVSVQRAEQLMELIDARGALTTSQAAAAAMFKLSHEARFS